MNSSLTVGIIGAIATVVSGIGGVVITLWVTRKREQEREQKKEVQRIQKEKEVQRIQKEKEVQGILIDLQKIEDDLKDNRVLFDDLEKDRDNSLDVIDQVGFPAFYHELPPGPRKIYWDMRVSDMRVKNEKILVRLGELTGNPELSDAFFNGCKDFRNHANEWERLWKLAMELEQEPESNAFIREQQKNRRRFPSSFESFLKAEIACLKRRYKRS